ncbi:MAG: efflux RND transporter periplasmic adaptor subunit [Pirellulaceae bacterium]
MTPSGNSPKTPGTGTTGTKLGRSESDVVNPPIDNEPWAIDAAQLHTRLHHLCMLEGNQSEIRSAFRKVILQHTGGIGVAHVLLDKEGTWTVPEDYTTGRIPRREDFIENFTKCCQATIHRNSIQIERFLGMAAVYAPINVEGSHTEVVLLLTAEQNASRSLFVLEIVIAYFSLWLKESSSDRSNWKLTSLAALIELVSQIEKQETLESACQVVASEIARYVACDQVAVGTSGKNGLKVQAISGNLSVDRFSDSCRTIETALNECLLRETLGVWPTADENDRHLLLAHQQMARESDAESVLSFPLVTIDGQTIGALLLTGSREMLHGDRLPNFVKAAGPRIAGALSAVARAYVPAWQRWLRAAKTQMQTRKGRVWYGLAVVLIAAMLVPLPYRVRCGCTTETTQRRFAVAPFDGLVKRGHVAPGDYVQQGQLLAEMDGQSIRLDLAAVGAEFNQSLKQREIELSRRNIPESLLADFEAQRLAARKDQLEFRQGQIEIRSPLDGYVLSGSLEHAEGASVETGKVIYEVGALESLKVEIAIPAEEVAWVEPGQSTRIWIEGLENQSFRGVISRIQPRSELRQGRNVFVAEVIVTNPYARLRPGMQGHARIDCRARPLAWNLLHKPINYLTSRLTWW